MWKACCWKACQYSVVSAFWLDWTDEFIGSDGSERTKWILETLFSCTIYKMLFFFILKPVACIFYYFVLWKIKAQLLTCLLHGVESFLEKLTSLQLVKKFTAFLWNPKVLYFNKISHSYMFRHYHAILRELVINAFPSYTSFQVQLLVIQTKTFHKVFMQVLNIRPPHKLPWWELQDQKVFIVNRIIFKF
jgi:hypothetical protein